MTVALIGAGSGLVLGISLLIWALRERGARHAAETERDNAKHALDNALLTNDRLRVEVNVIRRERNGCQAQLKVLHETIHGLHEQLAECKDPAAVEKLLNDELGEPV